jgi:hypothetical protein
VLSTSDVRQLADLEATKQQAGCDTSSCLSEIAGALGARYVVFGDATQLGSLLVVNLNLFDVQTAAAVRRASFEVNDPAEIPAQTRIAAAKLAGPPAAEEVTAPSALPLAPLSLVIVGGVLALGGLAFDAVSPTSNNRVYDLGDAVGPTVMLSGAAVLATGVVIWVVP